MGRRRRPPVNRLGRRSSPRPRRFSNSLHARAGQRENQHGNLDPGVNGGEQPVIGARPREIGEKRAERETSDGGAQQREQDAARPGDETRRARIEPPQ